MAVGWPISCAGGHEELGEGRECVFVTLAFKSGEEITDVWGGLRTRLVSSFHDPEPHTGCPYNKPFKKRKKALVGRNDGLNARSHPFSPKWQWRTLPCRSFPVTKALRPGSSAEF